MVEPWTQEQWAQLRDYADRVLVTIRLTNSPDEDSAEEWIIVSNGAAWPRDWLVSQVERIALSGTERAQDTPADYSVDIHERRLSWGADASIFEIALALATWAGTSAAWDATKSIARRMQQRLSGDHGPVDVVLSDGEAVKRASWEIALRYDEQRPSLQVMSVETGLRSATVVLNSSTWAYECHLDTTTGNLVTASRIKRTRLAG